MYKKKIIKIINDRFLILTDDNVTLKVNDNYNSLKFTLSEIVN